MDKWDKVVTLQRELTKNKYGCSLNHLMEKFEDCDRSTVYRIIALAELVFGIDIVKDPKTKKFNFDRTSGTLTELPGLWFKKSELEALICLQHAMTGLQQGYMEELLAPFKNRFKPVLGAQGINSDAWEQRFKILSILTRKVDNTIFETIADAVLHEKKVQIKYCKLGKRDTEERIISPQTLLRYRDNWYVDTWCHLRNELRTFSLSRIRSVKKLKEDAHRLPQQDLDAHYTKTFGIFSGKVKHEAEIVFTGSAAEEVSQEMWHPDQVGTWNKDSTEYLLKIPYSDSTELLMDILKWGDMAEVLAPPPLREKIVQMLSGAIKKYS